MVNIEGSGEPLRIIDFESGRIHLNKEALEKVLLGDRVKDKHVAVISLAGDFRKGKSFMLSFFLRFLYSHGSPLWLGDPNEPLHGFEWRNGCDRHTTGIMIWNEAFLVKTPQDGELVVLLMDTQGMQDDHTVVKESATIFALTTMVSSVLVYNISQNIQENDLQYLQLFTEYGRLAQQEQRDEKPFQKILFLVRDWYYLCDAKFGAEGGRKLLEKRLKVSENQHQQLKDVREHIHTCFEEIDCFLMPHPGLKVAQEKSFDGRLSDIEEDFKEQLLDFIPSLLAPKNLISKKINGHKITSKELVSYITKCVPMFEGCTLPEPTTVFQANATVDHERAVDKALQQYRTAMEQLRKGRKKSRKQLDNIHQKESARACEKFAKTPKMGGEEMSQFYLQKLSKEMNRFYVCFASGMVKEPFTATTCCKVAVVPAAIGVAAASTAFFIAVGIPIHIACCGLVVAFACGAFVGSLIYGCCVNVSSTDNQVINETFENLSNPSTSNTSFVSRIMSRLRGKAKRSSTPYCRLNES